MLLMARISLALAHAMLCSCAALLLLCTHSLPPLLPAFPQQDSFPGCWARPLAAPAASVVNLLAASLCCKGCMGCMGCIPILHGLHGLHWPHPCAAWGNQMKDVHTSTHTHACTCTGPDGGGAAGGLGPRGPPIPLLQPCAGPRRQPGCTGCGPAPAQPS